MGVSNLLVPSFVEHTANNFLSKNVSTLLFKYEMRRNLIGGEQGCRMDYLKERMDDNFLQVFRHSNNSLRTLIFAIFFNAAHFRLQKLFLNCNCTNIFEILVSRKGQRAYLHVYREWDLDSMQYYFALIFFIGNNRIWEWSSSPIQRTQNLLVALYNIGTKLRLIWPNFCENGIYTIFVEIWILLKLLMRPHNRKSIINLFHYYCLEQMFLKKTNKSSVKSNRQIFYFFHFLFVFTTLSRTTSCIG